MTVPTRRMAAAAGVVLVLVLVTGVGHATGARGRGGPPVEIGAVSTVAGPALCDLPATLDRASTKVGSLAVGAEGAMFVDTGPPAQGLVAGVDVSGRARVARTGSPWGSPGRLAPDGDGGALVAAGRRIDRIGAKGGVSSYAGDASGTPGPAGDGASFRDARFVGIQSVATDDAGNHYVVESTGTEGSGFRVRFINRSSNPITFHAATPHEVTVAPGAIDTVAGIRADSAAPPRVEKLQGRSPVLAVVGERLYFASLPVTEGSRRLQGEVRMINLGTEPLRAQGLTVQPGTVATVTGGLTGAAGATGPLGLDRRLGPTSFPGISADANGNLYLAAVDHHRVYRIDSAGATSVFAGSSRSPEVGGFNGNDRPALGARLNRPYDVKASADGLVYISDQLNHQVRFVDQAGIIHAAAGNGLGRTWMCPREQSGILNDAPQGLMRGVTTEDGGDVYFVVDGAPRLYRVRSSGRVEPAVKARLLRPQALASRSGGGIYVLEHARVRFFNSGTQSLRVHGVTVAAGAIQTVLEDDTSRATEKHQKAGKISGEGTLAVDRRGKLFLADSGARRVVSLDTTGKLETVLDLGNPGDPSRCCLQLEGLAVDPDGNLYMSDGMASTVWLLNRGSRPIARHGQTVPPGDMRAVVGTGSPARALSERVDAGSDPLGSPVSLDLDPQRNLYVLDAGDNTVRRIDAAGILTTIAGTGSPGFNGDGMRGTLTMLRHPAALAVDHCGNVLVADTANLRVRKVTLAGGCRATSRTASSPKRSLVLHRGVIVTTGVAGLAAVLLCGRHAHQGRRRSEG